jgi:peptidoglycan/LPS O-acetylase OafA/YrhL
VTVSANQPAALVLRTWPFRYDMIEGLRGLAALAVVLTHLLIVTVGHYAVMLFFVISGYCIAAATEAGRRKGMDCKEFLRRRLHRIYPPYFLAIVFYVLTRLVKAVWGGHNDLARPWLVWVQNLTMTQWVSLLSHPVADAPQNPALLISAFWSLNYEDQFYLVMAAALVLVIRRGVPVVVPVSVLAAVGLIWNCLLPGGWICGIFLEYWVHFAVGVLLFHALCVSTSRTFRYGFLAAVTALGLYCAMRILPWRPDMSVSLRVYVELAVVCSFTLFLYFARPLSELLSRSWLWRPVAALGVISYSLYLVNQFNERLVTEAASRLVPHAWEPARVVLMVALQVLLAAVFWYFCERPFLNRAAKGGTLSRTSAHVFEGAR